jgi:hypothetical protein
MCVQLNVGREVWLSTLIFNGRAALTDFRPTNEEHFESAPIDPIPIDERLLSAIQRDGRDRLIANANWLVALREEAPSDSSVG